MTISKRLLVAAALVSVVLWGCDDAPAGDADAGASRLDGGGVIADGSASLDGSGPTDAGPPPDEGRWGAPASTFTLPTLDEGEGYYYPDIQASFPDVDWDTLDRLYIPAGHYLHVRIGNLPSRDPSRPLVITNLGGQVRVGGLDHYYLFAIGGGSGWVLTGRYDSISQTGDAGFTGHRDGYANSAGRYGILVDDDFVHGGNSGISVGGGASDFEIEHLEVREVDFAGIVLKTDDTADAVMDGVVVHDVYIHDTGSEGFYIGSTQAQPQHRIAGLEIHHVRVLRAGTEAIQIGQLGGRVVVHHNVFGPSAIDWRAAFQRYQDGNLQVGVRSGLVELHHNIFLGGAGSQGSLFGSIVDGDTHDTSDRFWLHDNYYYGRRSLWMYVASRDLAPMTFRFEDNFVHGERFDYDEVYAGPPPGELLRRAGATTIVEVIGNTFEAPPTLRLCNAITDVDCNGSAEGATGSGNVRAEVAPVRFVESGLPDGFDWLELEMWTDVASLGGDAPVSYPNGRIVMHLAVPYRCDADPCAPGMVPSEHAELWTALPPLADDVRVAPGSEYEGMGI